MLETNWITVVSTTNAGAFLTLVAFYGAGMLVISCSAVAALVISTLALWIHQHENVCRCEAQPSVSMIA